MSLKSPRGRTTTLMTSKACDCAPVFHVTGRPARTRCRRLRAHTLPWATCAHAVMPHVVQQTWRGRVCVPRLLRHAFSCTGCCH